MRVDNECADKFFATSKSVEHRSEFLRDKCVKSVSVFSLKKEIYLAHIRLAL